MQNMKDGGVVKAPLNLQDGGEVNLNVVQKGTENRAAIADFLSKTFDDQQGIHPDVKDKISAAIDFIPILGDAKGAYELALELRKDPINWITVGVLAGGVVLALVPGLPSSVGKAISKAIATGTADLVGILRAAKDGDVEFLMGWGSVDETASIGARVAKSRSWHLMDPDTGELTEFSGTAKEFRDQFGVGESGAKKERGQTADGLLWSKSGDFSDKRTKTGNPLIATERLEDISLDEATSQKRYLPRGLSKEDSREVRETIYRAIKPHLLRKADQLDDGNIDAAEFFDPNEGWISSKGTVNFDKTKETAVEIAEESWGDIKAALQAKFGDLPTEDYNKVLAFARSKSRNMFDIRQKGSDGEFTRNYGVLSGLDELVETGSDAVKKSNKVPVKSGGMTIWVDPDDFDNVIKEGNPLLALIPKATRDRAIEKGQVPYSPDKSGAVFFIEPDEADWFKEREGMPLKELEDAFKKLRKEKRTQRTGISYGNHSQEDLDILTRAWEQDKHKVYKTKSAFIKSLDNYSDQALEFALRIAKKELGIPLDMCDGGLV